MHKGFTVGCRRFVGVDGCYLKIWGGWGGLLSVVALDVNNKIFPLVVCIYEVENKDT